MKITMICHGSVKLGNARVTRDEENAKLVVVETLEDFGEPSIYFLGSANGLVTEVGVLIISDSNQPTAFLMTEIPGSNWSAAVDTSHNGQEIHLLLVRGQDGGTAIEVVK